MGFFSRRFVFLLGFVLGNSVSWEGGSIQLEATVCSGKILFTSFEQSDWLSPGALPCGFYGPRLFFNFVARPIHGSSRLLQRYRFACSKKRK